MDRRCRVEGKDPREDLKSLESDAARRNSSIALMVVETMRLAVPPSLRDSIVMRAPGLDPSSSEEAVSQKICPGVVHDIRKARTSAATTNTNDQWCYAAHLDQPMRSSDMCRTKLDVNSPPEDHLSESGTEVSSSKKHCYCYRACSRNPPIMRSVI